VLAADSLPPAASSPRAPQTLYARFPPPAAWSVSGQQLNERGIEIDDPEGAEDFECLDEPVGRSDVCFADAS